MAEVLFYVLGALALLGATGVVLAKRPMFSVLSLLGSFFALSIIYLLAGFQFMAAAQIVVYAGAILVLFLFVIMLLDLGEEVDEEASAAGLFARPQARVAAVVAVGLALVGLLASQGGLLGPPSAHTDFADGIDALPALARAMFGRYGLAFEATGILLLVTMVAVIALAKRERKQAAPPPDEDGGSRA